MGNDALRVACRRVPGSSPGRSEERDGSYTVTLAILKYLLELPIVIGV
jgi:hypothetical protein